MVANEQDDFRRAEELVLEARRIVQQQKGRIIRRAYFWVLHIFDWVPF